MTDKKIYKLLAVLAYAFAMLATWFDPMTAITGILVAIYATRRAILTHLEGKE